MGVLLAKFRKERTTEELLEKLDERIKVLENYMHNTEEQKKRFVSNFLAFSIGIYVIALIIVYFRYFPTTWKEILLYFVPLLLVPFVIFRLRRVFTWYFQRKLNKNSDQLIALRAEKRKILEQVMDKETYKVAVNLLARFGEKNNINKPSFPLTPRPTSSTSQLRLRTNPSINLQTPQGTSTFSSLRTATTPNAMSTPNRLQLASSNRLGVEERDGGSLSTERTLNSPSPSRNSNLNSPRSSTMLRRQTPFPIINYQDKTVFERIVDVLIGDGPQDRFAMICKECCGHNGMATKDDFEYVAFNCAYCNAKNPARKSRPVAPRLSMNAPHRQDSSDTVSSSSSDDDESARPSNTSEKRSFSDISKASEATPESPQSSTRSESPKNNSTIRDQSVSGYNQSFDNNNEASSLLHKTKEDIKLHTSLLDVLKKEK